MRVIVIARCKNEQANIDRFCTAYSWAHRIILVDDHSDDTDYLYEAARLHKNLLWLSYRGQVIERGGVSRAAHGKQWNDAIWAAEQFDPDWIIHDDMDCFPNNHLKSKVQSIMRTTEKDFIYVTRVYMYMDKGYCSELSRENDEWIQGLYAWRAGKGFKFSESDPLVHTFTEPNEKCVLRLEPPMALLHYPWPDSFTIQKKIQFYDSLYDRKTLHPLRYAGDILPLELWMYE